MEGFAVIIDYSEHEREKVKFVLKNLGIGEFLEIKSIVEYPQMIDKLPEAVIIVMDIAFPGEKQGLEVLFSLRKKVGRRIPILITTKSDDMEHKASALKYGASDYIIKPYDTKRLINSVKCVIKLEKKFVYPTKDITPYQMSFEAYLNKEMKTAKRQGKPLSVILMTPVVSPSEIEKQPSPAGNILSELSSLPDFRETIHLRASDALFFNTNGDVLFILPFTCKEDCSGVCGRVRDKVGELLGDRGLSFDGMFYIITVTYPDDGNSFQAMMEGAYKHISDKQLLEKIASIPIDTRKFAKKRYDQFNRLF